MSIKKAAVILFLCIKSITSFSQRIVNNIFFKDIDEFYTVDSLLPKYRLYSVELYGCNDLKENEDSCILYCKLKYNEYGRLVELIKGDNLIENKVDYVVQYKKLSDTLFETVAKFPPNSTMIPEEIFIDTVIKGKKQRLCLYKKNKENSIVIKSVYNIDSTDTEPYEAKYIKRYDLDDKLVQIYYPAGSRTPIKNWSDTIIDEYNRKVSNSIIYAENYFKSINTYNKKNQLIETLYSNYTFYNNSYDYTKQMIIYDMNRPVIRVTVDDNNQILSEERYYYNDGILVRYTKDDNLKDSVLNEDICYNNVGQIVFMQSRPSYSNNTTTWKYFYNEKGMKIRDEYYFNNKFHSKRVYIYK